MHLTITLSNLSYDGSLYLTYDAYITRSDDPKKNHYSLFGHNFNASSYFEKEDIQSLYKSIGDECYFQLYTRLNLSPLPVNYIFVGDTIMGIPKINIIPTVITKNIK